MIVATDILVQPLLAFDGGAVGVIVFLVISFISWIMNTIQASKQQQEARQRQEARRRRREQQAAQGGGAPQGRAGGQPRVQSEIEAFLEEVTGQKQQPAKRPQPPRPPQRPKPQRAQARPPKLPKSTAPKPRPAELGSGVQQHVSTYMTDRIGEQVEQDIAGYVDQHINQHVSEHIGTETVTDDNLKRPAGNEAATAIRDMLKDGDGVRRAILVNEILKRRTFER